MGLRPSGCAVRRYPQRPATAALAVPHGGKIAQNQARHAGARREPRRRKSRSGGTDSAAHSRPAVLQPHSRERPGQLRAPASSLRREARHARRHHRQGRDQALGDHLPALGSALLPPLPPRCAEFAPEHVPGHRGLRLATALIHSGFSTHALGRPDSGVSSTSQARPRIWVDRGMTGTSDQPRAALAAWLVGRPLASWTLRDPDEARSSRAPGT